MISRSNRWLITAAWVSVIFVTVSLLATPVPGVNEPHYLCKARAFTNPAWCQRDFFLQSANAHSVFFAVVGEAVDVLPFAVVAIAGRVFSYSLLAIGWTLLSRRCGLNGWQTVLAAAVFAGIGQTGNFSGEWVIGGFESKVPSYGFALIAVALWTKLHHRGNLWLATLPGALLGLSIALHPVVGMWFVIALAMSECVLLTRRLILRSSPPDSTAAEATATDPAGERPLPTGSEHAFQQRLLRLGLLLLTALVCAAPGLLPAVQMVTSDNLPTQQRQVADFIQVFWRLAHHLDPSTFPRFAWLHTGILVVAVGIGSGLVLRGSNRQLSVQNRAALRHWLLLLGMAAVITGVGTIVGWHTVPAKALDNWQLRAFLLKFYPFRLFDALLPMTVGLLSALLLKQWQRSEATTRVQRGLTLVGCLLAFLLAGLARPGAPAGYTDQQYAAWQDACRWIQQHTDPDSLILTPRESFGFKWFAERAEYVCFKDCPQDAAGILEWNDRLWTIHGWSETSYRDGAFDPADLVKLRSLTGVTHLLTRSLGPIQLQPVYDNGVWRLYELPPAGKSTASSASNGNSGPG